MNLLLVSIDSLRCDFVSRTNLEIATSHFDKATEHFNFYPHCFSVSSATRPVHTSLFTGLYPFEHGVLGQNFARMRPGIPHLFDLFGQKNYAVGAFSEAHTVFEGLDYAPHVQPLPSAAAPGLQRIEKFLLNHRQQPRCLFLHYWSTHTPYGAADNRAFGETTQLLFGSGRNVVLERYKKAVIDLFEHKLTPLINNLDLSTWCVVVLGDHGESWTEDEPYHGQTLRNAVLRVPFYLHIPHTGNPPLEQPILSLIDLFPTLVSLFDLRVDYRGFGRDFFTAPANLPYLAQIHPLPTQNDLKALGIQSSEGLKWALFDAQEKFTFDETTQQGLLQETLTEKVILKQGGKARFLERYAQILQHSAYAGKQITTHSEKDSALLEKRLEQLGYL